MTGRRSDIFALVFVLAGVFALSVAAREMVAIGVGSRSVSAPLVGESRALAVTPRAWRRLRDLASIEQLTGRLDRAAAHYREAIAVFPACSSCWMGLAETLHASGQDPTEALRNAVRVGRSATRVRTRAAVLYERLGMRPQALAEFRAAIGGRRDDKRDFYELLHRIYDTEIILDSVVPPDDLRGYFAFARARRPAADVDSVWRRWSERLGENARAEYVGDLVRDGRLRRAWQLEFGPRAAVGSVPNGDFESDGATAGPFAWRLRDADGVRAAIVDCGDCPAGSKALRLRFDGEHDPHHVGAALRVPTEPGASYRLHASVKTFEITSPSGPALVVTGVAPEGAPGCRLREASEGFRLTRGWKAVSVDFRVPDGCDGVRIFVERQRSAEAVNRLIGGDFYLDDVRLERRS